jgi:CRISPR-associated protein Cmr3
MTPKHQLQIEPRDPLLARDGRPFGAGQRAKTLDFPLPSTIAGAVRTRAGSDAEGVFEKTKAEALEWGVSGAMLYNPDSNTLFVPAPLDALMLDEKSLFPLSPVDTAAIGTSCNLQYAPIGTTKHLEGKPKGMPKYWFWENFKQWLLNPTEQCIEPKDLGIAGPTLETRTHVKIDPTAQTAEESQLFSTSALEFRYLPKLEQHEKHKRLSKVQRLALQVATSAPQQNHSLWSIGGERRLSEWGEGATFPSHTDPTVQSIIQSICDQEHLPCYCRIILLTPGYFAQGWKPDNAFGEHTLIGAAVGRPQVVSGWDYAKGEPKATRRLVPAGSVYFLKLEGAKTDIKKWIEEHWFQAIGDDPQACKDGFGLAVFGTWDGGKVVPDLSTEGEKPCPEPK